MYQFFSEKDYIVIAQGKRIQNSGKIKDFADVLFLLSSDMEYFHAVTLHGIKYDHFKACIFTSAREVDFQFAPPIPGVLERNNREHFVFLFDETPENGKCSPQEKACSSWSAWSRNREQTSLLSAYAYSSNWASDPYSEIVELTLDNKKITPSRGALTQHARKKYALRLRNQLKESKEDTIAAKTAYRNIYNEVDHKLPLMLLNLTADRKWQISEINREKGTVQDIIHGKDLELYPMPNTSYKRFLPEIKK